MAGEIYIKGLGEFRRDLRRVDPQLAKGVREAVDDAARIVADEARHRAPVRSGLLVSSIRASASGDRAEVSATARRVSRGYPSGYPYPWRIEYGAGGREAFIRPALEAKREEVIRRMGHVVDDVAETWRG